MDLAGRNVVVLGLARSGEAAARALLAADAKVTVLDGTDGEQQRARATLLGDARVVLGRTDPADLDGAELVVASPGVAPSSPWLAAAAAAGVPAWSEIELAYRLGARPVVAITGTNGKTTTTEMVAAALTADGRRAIAAGNVGLPLLDVIDGGYDAIVAEVSSFQLHLVDRFRAPVAVLLNVARDHLDWHGSFDAYVAAKARIFESQTEADTAVFHVDEVCAGLARGRAQPVPFSEDVLPPSGAGIADGWIVVPRGRVVKVGSLGARGRPNRTDAVAAAAAASALGADLEAIGEALALYRAKPHRIEMVASIERVTFIDDSKATDPHATLAALEELDRVVLIAGGRNKGLDLGELTEATARLRAVIAIGEAAGEVEAGVDGPGLCGSNAPKG